MAFFKNNFLFVNLIFIIFAFKWGKIKELRKFKIITIFHMNFGLLNDHKSSLFTIKS